MNLPQLILASASPRRAEILTAVGWPFTKRVADVDETINPGEAPAGYVTRLAREKAEAVTRSGEIVLGADTTVVIGGEILGKPSDLDEARQMLRRLSGNWHEVLTGVAIGRRAELLSAVETTRVKFSTMSDAEIEFLVQHGAPLDKAGAYAVQAQAALFIERIEGDYWNVVGLPIGLVYRLIMKTPDD